VSKSPKDSVDWRSGSEALFQAARGDHDASAADYARVEAELARRIAAGAQAKHALGDEQESVAKLARAWTPGTIAKVWIGVALLAAGSLALMLTSNFAPSRVARPAGSAPPQPAPAAPAHDRAPDTAPKETGSSPISELADAPRLRERARHEGPARVASPRTALRDSAPPKRSSARHSAYASSDSKPAPPPIAPTPASVDMDSRTGEVSAQPAPSRGTSLQQPDPKPAARPPQLLAAATTLETPPAAAEANARTQTRPVPIRVDASADARAELALVERMHAAMRAAKPAEALELCAEHAERWPRGVFTEEREAVSAIALHVRDSS